MRTFIFACLVVAGVAALSAAILLEFVQESASTAFAESSASLFEESTAAMPSLLELHSMAGVHKLPVRDIEDHSLIYPPSTANEEARPKP